MAQGDGTPDLLLGRAVEGDTAALARLLSLTESDPAAVASAVWGIERDAHVIGITGPPGTGKSTLASAMVTALRAQSATVAVLAIDPTSPNSGGALLADRIRMAPHVVDPNVFIRSFATRGSVGGLSAAVPLAIRTLEAAAFSHVIVETVGVGQVELDIASYADTVLVVLHPGWGDSLQANKAGILEIADVFVVNKADRPGADQAVGELHLAQSFGRASNDDRWPEIPIVETVATEGRGIDELVEQIRAHRQWLDREGAVEGRARRAQRVTDHLALVVGSLLEGTKSEILASVRFEEAAADVLQRRRDPWAAASELVELSRSSM